MAATILDGKTLAATVRREVSQDVAELTQQGIIPGLAMVMLGNDPASAIYVRSKEKAAEQVGVIAHDYHLPAETSERQLLDLVQRLNNDPAIDGILVQLPLPKHIDPDLIQDSIVPSKDVDGFHVDNLGRLSQGRPRFVAATPKGCMRLLQETGIDPAGKHAVVVGRSNIVGKPMAMLLTNANATVTLCHSRTPDLGAVVSQADIVVAAIGKAELIRGAWIKPGAVVIDVGMNRKPDGKLVGDVEFAAASERASAITPVPGGVGPMTIASLLQNTVQSAQMRAKRSQGGL